MYKCSLKTVIDTPELHTFSELNNNTKAVYHFIFSSRLKLANKIHLCYLTWEFQGKGVDQHEKEWFCAKEVCKALEYGKTTKSADIVKNHCSKEKICPKVSNEQCHRSGDTNPLAKRFAKIRLLFSCLLSRYPLDQPYTNKSCFKNN